MAQPWSLEAYLANHQNRVNQFLEHLPSSEVSDSKAKQAFQYALRSPGKRFRPLLTLATADLYQKGNSEDMLKLAAAVECIHAASLILDDLPCMDDANLRRGLPTTHKRFGEGQAILASMGLISQAHALALQACRKNRNREFILELVTACYGLSGLSTGQSHDLEPELLKSLGEMERIHALKTGALFTASVELACLQANAPKRERTWLVAYAKNLGLAFQVKDDLLDKEHPEVIGKDQGKDQKKVNFVKIMGTQQATKLYDDLMETAMRHLEPLGKSAFHLVALTKIIWNRSK